MSETKYTIERDLREAMSMVEGLTPYIYEDQLYGRVGGMFGGMSMPSLTPGALLTRLRRLRGFLEVMTQSQRERLDTIVQANERTAKEWRHHYEEKLVREATSRLEAMKQFFEECTDLPRLCPSLYLPEAYRRTVVEEALDQLDDWNVNTEDLRARAKTVDNNLRRILERGSFIWDKQLKNTYPENKFWWLYGTPPDVDFVNER